MVRILGAVLIGGCTAWMGSSMAERSKIRLRAVTELRDGLMKTEQKIACYRLPLPVLLREVSVEQADRFSPFYAKAAAKLETEKRKSTEQVLLSCFRTEVGDWLPDEAVLCCRRVFASLGQLDAGHQAEGLRRAVSELDGLEARLREEVRKQGRCWSALGICGGLAVTILLV